MSEALVVALVLAGLIVVLVKEYFSPAVAFLTALGILLGLGIVNVDQALSGFNNEALLLIASLFVVARAVEKSGFATRLANSLIGKAKTPRSILSRLMLPVVGLSSFLNNTPIVAMLIPVVTRVANKRRFSPSLFLMPLSFAAILGGVVTLIGTSTNIIVSSLMEGARLEPIGFFEISKVGLPIAVLGTLTVVLTAPRLLQQRRKPQEDIEEAVSEYIVTMRVGRQLAGTAIRRAGLRNLKGAFLAELVRGDQVFAPVNPDIILHQGDELKFVGNSNRLLELQKKKGLVHTEHKHVRELDNAKTAYFETVIGTSSPLVGKTIKEAGFRGVYQAAVLSVSRDGERIDAKPGSIRLKAGDTLLLAADKFFKDRWANRKDFLVINPLNFRAPLLKHTVHGYTLLAIVVGVVLLAATGAVPLVGAVLLGALATIITGVLTPEEARSALDFELLIMMGAAISLATAVNNSGLTNTIVSSVTNTFSVLGSIGVLAGVVLSTVVLTAFVTNTAAAALMFPIAISAASAVGADPRGFAIAVAVAASVDFLTPFGYQTNTMVYGPGSYKFTDYARLGLPLTIVMLAVLLVGVPYFW